MKSILVDAIRQANEKEPETNLSDSGSFDATQEDFSAPANQDLIDAGFEEEAGELELMSTTTGLVVPGDDDRDSESMPARPGDTMSGGTVLLTSSDYIIPDNDSLPPMPKLARHVPMLCVALALIAGASWYGYQHLDLEPGASGLGAFTVQSQAASARDELLSGDSSEPRFRYLTNAFPESDPEAEQ